MRLERLEAILLDLDGTLIQSHAVLWETYASFLHQHDSDPTAAEFAALDGPSVSEIVARLRETHGLAEPVAALEADYRALLARQYPDAPAAPGADELLLALAGRLRVGLVTSAPGELAGQALLRRGWAGRFDVVVAGDDGPAKPAPALYLAALAGLGISPDRALAAEDSVNGVLSAAAAGVPVVGITALPERALRLREAGAVQVVADLRELVEFLL